MTFCTLNGASFTSLICHVRYCNCLSECNADHFTLQEAVILTASRYRRRRDCPSTAFGSSLMQAFESSFRAATYGVLHVRRHLDTRRAARNNHGAGSSMLKTKPLLYSVSARYIFSSFASCTQPAWHRGIVACPADLMMLLLSQARSTACIYGDKGAIRQLSWFLTWLHT